ncbi:MAG: T9SS sorting signal type C domain-containing protein [Methylotenera sp.]|nr:T9SS sorting signal type C domain-containing protein [Flavobacterium sp.]
MIKKLLTTLFFVLIHSLVSAQTNTYIGANGSWNIAANWSLGLVPTASHDVVIPSGKIVTVSANASANNLSVLGTGVLIVKDAITFTLYGNVTVDSAAKFNAGEGNNDSAIIKVYGNFINQGEANFYKSIVIIGGDLITASTILQNNGNIVVGGNVSGVIGGSGSGTVYPTNPNAIVTVTGDATEKPAGTLPTDSALVILMNEAIYGGSCPFTVNNIDNVTACSGSNIVFIITTNAATPSYLWQVNTSGSGWVDLINGPTYSGVNSSTLTITVVTTGMDNYRYRAKITSGSPSCSKNGNYGVLTISTSSTTWNGSAWSNGIPAGVSSIIFTGSYPPAVDPNVNLSGCSCRVSNTAKVTIKSGRTLTVVNEVTIDASGELTFENNASLVQTANSTTNTNSGKITYQRQTSPYNPFDYIYWSSPVVGQILRDVSPLTPLDKFYSFDVAKYDWKPENPNSPMTNGVGYIIRGADYKLPTPPGLHQASFFGIPNNGLITVAIPSTAVNSESSALLGNPYPSALDANEFLKGNTSILEGTLYFWTHNTAIQNVGNITNGSQGSGALAYTSDDYATYNLTGGVTVVSGNIVAGIAQPLNKPSGKIASGQSFFAGIKSNAGTVKFENSMRVGVGSLTGNNTQFFRTASGKSDVTTAHENHRVWLNLTNMKGAFKQLLVGYITGATNAYDPFFDGVSFNGNEFVDFYSITDDETLTIQGRALPFDENDMVSLGYSSIIEGEFSINIDEVDGIMQSQEVYLEDKIVGLVHDLKVSPYTFTTAKGTFDDRFVLRYTDKTLGVADLEQLKDQVIISKDKNELKIKSTTETIKRVTIFDLLGKKVFDKEALEETEFRSSNVSLFKQLGIVKVTLATGQVISKKVAF